MSSQHESSSDRTGPTSSAASGDDLDSRSDRVRSQISELAQSAKSQASAAIQPITDNARSMAEEQKTKGAERIGNVAQAVHNAADEIGREMPFAANYVHAAAAKLDDAANLLRDNSVEGLAQKATDFAEERPIMFVGGAVAVGFVLARFLRSSAGGAGRDEE